MADLNDIAVFQSAFTDFLLAADMQQAPALRLWLDQSATAGEQSNRTTAGLRVYRNNVMYSLTQALAAQFPVVQKLVGTEFFTALARDYVRQEPPLDPSLTYYGHLFASFIRIVPACRTLPYLADVAALELLCQRALHAADDAALDMLQLSSVDPERLGETYFHLQASAALFTSDYPVYRIWEANLADSDEEIQLDGQNKNYLLVYRRGLEVQVVSLQPQAFTLLHQLQLGQCLQDACTFVEDQHGLDITELTPLLGYLLGLDVFSRFELPTQGINDE